MESRQDLKDWDRNAESYASSAPKLSETDYPSKYIWGLMRDVAGLNILDLGCGDGRLCSSLVRKGASVVGVDGSQELLGRAKESDPGIDYLQYDLAEGIPALSQKFDIVVSTMTVMDIPEIGPLFRAVPDVLAPHGKFIFSLLHPAFWNQKSTLDESTGEWFKRVKGYLTPEIWRVESFGGHNHYHRSISYYVQALYSAGMVVSQLLEPRQEPQSDTIPLEFLSQFPLFLIIEAVKTN